MRKLRTTEFAALVDRRSKDLGYTQDEVQRRSVELTVKWAARCKAEYEKLMKKWPRARFFLMDALPGASPEGDEKNRLREKFNREI